MSTVCEWDHEEEMVLESTTATATNIGPRYYGEEEYNSTKFNI